MLLFFYKSTIIALSLYIIFLHCLPMWSRAHSQVICIDIPSGQDVLACKPAFSHPFSLLSRLLEALAGGGSKGWDVGTRTSYQNPFFQPVDQL